jgi:hypothetical protein
MSDSSDDMEAGTQLYEAHIEREQLRDRAVLCPYCHNRAVLENGSIIYPHRPDLHSKLFWACPGSCDAWVGCHPGTTRPMGRIANKILRRSKMEAHAAFDTKWKVEGMTRPDAYEWLQKRLGLSAEECHIGLMDVDGCKRVVEVCGKESLK